MYRHGVPYHRDGYTGLRAKAEALAVAERPHPFPTAVIHAYTVIAHLTTMTTSYSLSAIGT